MQSPPKTPIPKDLATILEAMEEGVLVADGTGTVVFANETAAKVLGVATPGDAEGESRLGLLARLQFLHENGAPVKPEETPGARALRGEQPPPVSLRARTADGERRAVVSVTTLLDERARVRRIVSVYQDVTAQRRSEDALRLLAEAGRALAESLDYQRTLKVLVELAVPTLADGCAVELFEEDGSIQGTSRHADPARDALATEMRRRYPLRREAGAGSGKAATSGQPQLIREVTDELIRQVAVNEEHAGMLRRLGYRSIIAVPLSARGRTVGVLTLMTAESGRQFDEADLALAVELAGRAALAVDNARLYGDTARALERKDDEARTSETLRRIGASIASELDPERLTRRLIDEAIAACGAEAGVFQYTRPTEQGEQPTVTTGSAQDAAAGGRAAPQAGGALPVALEGPVRVEDLRADPRFSGWAAEPVLGVAGARALLAVPVRDREGRVVAGLLLSHSTPGAFQARHEALLSDIAAQASIALENARLFHQLRLAEARSRASEERLRLALEAGQMGHFDLDLRSQRAFLSPRLLEMLGLPPGAEVHSLDAFVERLHPEDREPLLQRVQWIIRERVEDDFFPYRINRPDGLRWIEGHSKLVLDAEGKPARMLGVAVDVTERTVAEQQALRYVGEQAARAEAEAGQRRIEAILDSISEPLFALDPEGRVRFVNRRAEQLVGRGRAELAGKPARELPPFSSRPDVLERCWRALAEGGPVELEAQQLNGLWYELRASPFHDGLSIYLRDITARMREQEAQARIARYEALRADVSTALSTQVPLPVTLLRCCEALVNRLEVESALVWSYDAENKLLELQAGAGGPVVPDDPLLRVPLGHLRVGRIAEEKRPYLTNEAMGDSQLGDRSWLLRRNLVAFAGYPLVVGDQLIGVLGMFSPRPLPEDVVPALSPIADALAQGVERRRAEQALKAHTEELERSNRELDQFAYVASHDLQEPLRMVASYTQLLARRYKGKLDADADAFIGFAVDGVGQMKHLISDLLDYSRVGTRGKELGPVALGQVLEVVTAKLQPAIEATGATVTFDPLPTVMGDEGQLEQLLENLLANALKFRSPAPPRVHVGATRHEREWVLSVQDNGIGIDSQYFQRIFVIFQRLHGKNEYPGTGIGLAICKKIVERHGGRIWVESAVGQGATFFFSLPNLNADPTRAMRDV